MNNDIALRVKKCIESAVEHEVDDLEYETSLVNDLGMESVNIVMLQVELEDEFNIEFDPLNNDFFEIFRTVGSVCRAIEELTE